MNPEEIVSLGIAHYSSVEILQKASKGKKITLKEYLMLYIDDMEEDSTLLEWCNTERERTLAYAIIALNSRIMSEADPMEMYSFLIDEKPKTETEFDNLKVKLKHKGYEPMTEEELRELQIEQAKAWDLDITEID